MKAETSYKINNKSSIQGVSEDRKREPILELSLPALVLGQNALGKRFEENSVILGISSEQASFWLKTPVKIGTPLKLILNIPATPFLLYPLKLELSGKICRIEGNGNKKLRQKVTIELDRKFKLGTLSETSKN